MAKKKNSTVELEVNGRTVPFEITHAERLLRMVNNGGWQLPENSRYAFTHKDGIIIRENKPATAKARKDRGNTSGNKASE